MLNRFVAAVLTLLLIAAWVPSGFPAAAAEPASKPAAVLTSPAALDPKTESILDRLEKTGAHIDNIEAHIEYKKIDTILQDEQKFSGTLRFMKGSPNPRFLIMFDSKEHYKIVYKDKEWHAFDGRWYTDARAKTKQITRREIVGPDDQREVFRLGEGPFPLPFGQKKADILRHFSVQCVSSDKPEDPKNADHLELTPRPGTEMSRKYDTVHFYVDRNRGLPVRVSTMDKEESNEIIVSFPADQIKVNISMAASRLDLPRLPGYKVVEERLESQVSTFEPRE